MREKGGSESPLFLLQYTQQKQADNVNKTIALKMKKR